MALTTYAELQAEIALWLHRGDLTAQIPSFIQLAESEINADMRLRLAEVDVPLTLSAGARTIALPANYSEPVRLDLVFTGRDNETLTYLTPQQMPIETLTGAAYQPQYWTINGANIEFPAMADQAYSVLFRMVADFDIAATSTNDLLAKYPGVYLYGALLHAAPYMANDGRISTWERMYESVKTKASKQEARTRALTALRTELPGTGNRSNIFRG